MNERQTILLVDDSEDDLMILRTAFKRAGINNSLQQVENGEKAIAYLQGEAPYNDRHQYPLPAVLLLDLNMPQKNGFELLKWLRSQPAFKRLTAVVLTASMRMEDVERAYDLGANSYLVKPATLEELVATVRCLGDWLQINHFPPHNEAVRR